MNDEVASSASDTINCSAPLVKSSARTEAQCTEINKVDKVTKATIARVASFILANSALVYFVVTGRANSKPRSGSGRDVLGPSLPFRISSFRRCLYRLLIEA